MNVIFARAEQRKHRLLAELNKRLLRAEQSRRGYFDDYGVLQGGLMAFIRHYWHVLEPEAELIEGWALYAIVLHLEAVTFGEIKRLLITVPPGFMKSLCTDVFWPAWEWGPQNLAHQRYIAFSYSASLTERDNNRFRDLVLHPSYKELWADRVQIVQAGSVKISNSKKGWKLASSVGGVGTGERGGRIILDDAHNIKEAESEVVRTETVRWFRESMSDRLNDLVTDVIVAIMQRSHAQDVAGAILDLQLPYCHLMIPMEYDWDRQVDQNGEPHKTEIGWFDPRYVAGNPDACNKTLAWVERFPPEVVESLRTVKGPYAYAGQYQQAPAPRGGGIFKRAWWQVWDHPEGKFPPLEYIMASLDGAFTEKESNSPSALTVWGIFLEKEAKRRRIILLHAWRKFVEFSGPRIDPLVVDTEIDGMIWPAELIVPATSPHIARMRMANYRRRAMPSWGLIEHVADTCDRFKVDKLLIEAKASGMSAASELQNRYRDRTWSVELQPVCGDKFSRALAVQPTFSQLMVFAPIRDWAEMVIEEMETFPKHAYNDLTDSTSQALKHFRDIGLANTDTEAQAEEIARVMHRPQPKALYPV
jgi:predicted phage terminase large subunit-like protein